MCLLLLQSSIADKEVPGRVFWQIPYFWLQNRWPDHLPEAECRCHRCLQLPVPFSFL
ncbi:hypothetical protein DF182_30425 [Chitinophaga flava]|uniref:Uncharacterized protein n=1 Tax=Chitinophaga flava TaxID=2259036 RepID=A0A365XX16_9BACT|nr:hypothetical protein DF182_30425 [Chitinophaga flava]